MRVLFLFLMVAAVSAQTPPPGFIRGVVTASGSQSFSVRTASGDSYQYRTDSRTWIERDRGRIFAVSLKPGETLEVVSDRDPVPIRYARLVHVIDPPVRQTLPVSTGGVYRLKPKPPGPLSTLTGLIVAVQADRLTLRTRFDGDRLIYLQPDTRYLKDGDQVDPKQLLPHTHVSITASDDRDSNLTAHQIVWGSLLEPRP